MYADLKTPKRDKHGRPLEDRCRDCGKIFPLDYTNEDKYKDDQLGPVRNYCGKCNSGPNTHYYPFI